MLEGDLFENAITAMKQARGVDNDTDLSADDLKTLVDEFKAIVAENISADEYPELVVDGVVDLPAGRATSSSSCRSRRSSSPG